MFPQTGHVETFVTLHRRGSVPIGLPPADHRALARPYSGLAQRRSPQPAETFPISAIGSDGMFGGIAAGVQLIGLAVIVFGVLRVLRAP